MKKLGMVVALLLMCNVVWGGAPDRRISDNDGDVLDLNSDGSVKVTLSGNLILGSSSITCTAPGCQFDTDNDGAIEVIMTSGGNVGIGTTTPTSLLEVNGSIDADMDVTLDTTATIVLTAADCKGAIRVNNDDDAIDYTLPNATTGLSCLFQSMFAKVVTIDCFDTNESIVLDSTTLAAGNAIDSPGLTGNYVLIIAISSTQWVVMGQSGVWVDGGVN